VENRSGTRELWIRQCGGLQNSPTSGVFRAAIIVSLFVFFAVFVLGTRELHAYPITLTFKTASGQGVPSIKIRGSHGINSLSMLTTDANGNWTFDTNSLYALDGVIVFSGVNAGMQLSPAEVKVADLVARGVRKQEILATPSSQPSTIVSWSFYSSGTTPLRSQPVSLVNPQVLGCEQRFTDQNGYVAWSVPRPKSKCDGLTDETGWLQIVPHEAPGMRCSAFSTYRSTGMKLCPLTGDDEAGISAATCTAIANPAPSLSSKIQISVQAAGTTNGVQGVTLVGNSNFMALSSRATDAAGNFTFSIGSVPGASATTAFEIAPVAQGYEFIPRKRDSRECAFSANDTYVCEFSAVRTFSPQGALIVDVTQSSQPISGVSITNSVTGLGCMPSEVKFSDWMGRVVLPVRTRKACQTLPDSPAWATPVSIYPAMTGKRFISSSDFQYCPTSLLTTAPIQAYDQSSGVQNYSIAGRVIALDGGPFAGVPIFMNGQEASHTDAAGRFEISPIAQGTNAKIEARLSPYAFDPEFETFSSVGSNIETTIVARAPDPLGGGIEPPQESCPVKTEYTLRGRVLDRAGNPIQGAHIHNNNREEPEATTDSNGTFSIVAPFGSDNWVTVEHEAALFSPAGRSLVDTVCDEDDLNFQQVDFASATVSGRVIGVDGNGQSGVPIKVTVNGLPLGFDLSTGTNGMFMFTAPLGSEVVIAPVSNSTAYFFDPSVLGPLTVEADVEGLEFRMYPAARTDATVTGRVIDVSVRGAPGVPIGVTVNGLPFGSDVKSGTDGIFTFTVPLGSVVAITPDPNSTTYLFYPTGFGPATVTGDTSAGEFYMYPAGPPPPTIAPRATSTPSVAVPSPTATPSTWIPTIAPTQVPEPRITSAPPAAQTPTPPPSTTWAPTPIVAPTETSRGPSATPVPMPSSTPPPASTPQVPPTQTAQPTATPVLTATPVPTQVPMNTATPAPVIFVAARCGSSAKQYDWVIANLGSVQIESARWRVFDASQPSVSFEGALFSLAPGQKMEVFDTPRMDISPRFYRLMVYVIDNLGRELSLAVEPWDLIRCMQGIPTPEPTTPSDPGGPPPAPIESTPTPVPEVPVPTLPPVSTPLPPVSTPLPLQTAVPTFTPTPSFELNVETRHWRNGRPMTEALFRQMASRGVLVIRGRSGTQFEQRVPLSEFSQSQYDYTTFLPAGSYRIGFSGGVRVVSVFRKNVTSYTCTVGSTRGARNRCRGIRFALQPMSGGRQPLLSGGRR
jgi:hypothetical protein